MIANNIEELNLFVQTLILAQTFLNTVLQLGNIIKVLGGANQILEGKLLKIGKISEVLMVQIWFSLMRYGWVQAGAPKLQ